MNEVSEPRENLIKPDIQNPMGTLHNTSFRNVMSSSENSRFVDPQAELRRRYREAGRKYEAARRTLMAAGVPVYEMGRHLPRVDWAEFSGLRCGAKNRKGTPCKRVDIYASGRCKLHGGHSTGPKTPEGKARALRNLTSRRADNRPDSAR